VEGAEGRGGKGRRRASVAHMMWAVASAAADSRGIGSRETTGAPRVSSHAEYGLSQAHVCSPRDARIRCDNVAAVGGDAVATGAALQQTLSRSSGGYDEQWTRSQPFGSLEHMTSDWRELPREQIEFSSRNSSAAASKTQQAQQPTPGLWRDWKAYSVSRLNSRRHSSDVSALRATVALVKFYERLSLEQHCHYEVRLEPSSAWTQRPARRVLTEPSEAVHNHGYDNAEHDYILHVNDVISAPLSNTCDDMSNNVATIGRTGGGAGLTTLSDEHERERGPAAYLVKSMLGTGTFGQVVECVHLSSRQTVAVKVIKNLPAYFRQAWMEVYILDMIQRRARDIGANSTRIKRINDAQYCGGSRLPTDPGTSAPLTLDYMIELRGYFVFREHLCLVFDKLGLNLFEVIKKNGYVGLPLRLVRIYMKQILSTLVVLEQLDIIHCDLKPENILLDTSWCAHCEASTQNNSRGFGVSTNCGGSAVESDLFCSICSHPRGVKVIDFGSACWGSDAVYTYVQSRFYRAPEVLLNAPYSTKVDIWSLGCIACELFLGLPLFPGHSEHNMICRIVEMLGNIPQELLSSSKQPDKFFERDAQGFLCIKLEHADNAGRTDSKYMTDEQASHVVDQQPSSWKRYFKHRDVRDILMTHSLGERSPSRSEIHMDTFEFAERECFVDFVSGLLQLDPNRRWSAAEAQQHPFVRNELLPHRQSGRRDSYSFANRGMDRASRLALERRVGGSDEVYRYSCGSDSHGTLEFASRIDFSDVDPQRNFSIGRLSSNVAAQSCREARSSLAVENEMNAHAQISSAQGRSRNGVMFEPDVNPNYQAAMRSANVLRASANCPAALDWATEYERTASALGDFRVAELNKRYSTALKQILARDASYASAEQFEEVERYIQAAQSSAHMTGLPRISQQLSRPEYDNARYEQLCPSTRDASLPAENLSRHQYKHLTTAVEPTHGWHNEDRLGWRTLQGSASSSRKLTDCDSTDMPTLFSVQETPGARESLYLGHELPARSSHMGARRVAAYASPEFASRGETFSNPARPAMAELPAMPVDSAQLHRTEERTPPWMSHTEYRNDAARMASWLSHDPPGAAYPQYGGTFAEE